MRAQTNSVQISHNHSVEKEEPTLDWTIEEVFRWYLLASNNEIDKKCEQIKNTLLEQYERNKEDIISDMNTMNMINTMSTLSIICDDENNNIDSISSNKNNKSNGNNDDDDNNNANSNIISNHKTSNKDMNHKNLCSTTTTTVPKIATKKDKEQIMYLDENGKGSENAANSMALLQQKRHDFMGKRNTRSADATATTTAALTSTRMPKQPFCIVNSSSNSNIAKTTKKTALRDKGTKLVTRNNHYTTIHVRTISGPYKGNTYRLFPKKRYPCWIGRSQKNKFTNRGISLPNDLGITAAHGYFSYESNALYYTDAGSTNGTKIGTNGGNRSSHKCADNDENWYEIESNKPIKLYCNMHLILGDTTLKVINLA